MKLKPKKRWTAVAKRSMMGPAKEAFGQTPTMRGRMGRKMIQNLVHHSQETQTVLLDKISMALIGVKQLTMPQKFTGNEEVESVIGHNGP